MVKLTIRSEEVNFAIYKYLTENGFQHSAFAFKHEANISWAFTSGEKQDIKQGVLHNSRNLKPRSFFPSQCLITLIHKAILYLWIEYHTDSSTGEIVPCDSAFSLFRSHQCSTRQPDKKTAKLRKTTARPESPKVSNRVANEENSSNEAKVELSPSVEISSTKPRSRSKATKREPAPETERASGASRQETEAMEIDEPVDDSPTASQPLVDSSKLDTTYSSADLDIIFDKNDQRNNCREVEDQTYVAASLDEDLIMGVQDSEEWIVVVRIPSPIKTFVSRVFELSPLADMVAVWWESPQASVGDLHLYAINISEKTYSDIPLGSESTNLASVVSIRWSLVNLAFKVILSRRREKYQMVFRAAKSGQQWYLEESTSVK